MTRLIVFLWLAIAAATIVACGDSKSQTTGTVLPATVASTPVDSSHLITVDKRTFRLTLWGHRNNHYVAEHRYPVAIGRPAYPTPSGIFVMTAKVKDPSWAAPNRPWVPKDQRGKTLPDNDPRNPLKGAFLLLGDSGGVGIHGTKFNPQVGTRASHGCIRMNVPDVIDLFGRVSLGTPVLIR